MNLRESKCGARERTPWRAFAGVCLTILFVPQSNLAEQIPGGWSVQYPTAGTLGGVTRPYRARTRYQAAVKSRLYQEQTFEGEQGKYELGASTSYFVIQAQRDLAAARPAEIAALSAYNKARTDLDRAAGQTISANNIVIEEARRGQGSREPGPIPVFDRE